MEEADRYGIAADAVLLAAGAALLAAQNASLLWLWLFLLICFVFLILLNDFLLKESHGWNRILSAVSCALALLIASLTNGYGSVPLVIIAQAGLCARYGKKASVWLSAALYLSLLAILYGAPVHAARSPAPAVCIASLGTAAQLYFMSARESARKLQESALKINELQKNKKELRDLNRQMEQFTADREKMTVLRERSRMSKKIHDTLGHTLTAVSVQLGAAEMLLKKNPDEALAKIANAREQTREGLDRIRQTLSMIDGDSLQFEDGILTVIRRAEETMSVKILSQLSLKRALPGAVQDFLLEALREGITNAVRHGGATALVLRLQADGRTVSLYLEDNGKGCEKIHMGYGLTAMEKQAQSFLGSFAVHSIPDEGFVLEISVPLEET